MGENTEANYGEAGGEQRQSPAPPEEEQQYQPEDAKGRQRKTGEHPANGKKHSLWRRFRETRIANQANIVFSLLIVVATISYAIIAGVTLHVMRVGMRSTSDQTERLIQEAEGIKVQLDQSVQQNKTALEQTLSQSKQALDATIASARTDQRAWMDIIINAPSAFQEDRPFVTTAEMKNLGKTPAKNIQVGRLFEGVPPSTQTVFDDTRLTFSKAGMLPPQGPSTMPVEINPGNPDELLGKERFEAIRDRALVVYFWGLIKYDDVFGFHHWLKFCYIYNVAHRRFNLVSRHNDIDEETR